MSNIIIISGSPSSVSRASTIAEYIGELLNKNGHKTQHLKVRDLPSEDLLHANFNSPSIIEAVNSVVNADAVVVVSPVYKASYTGVLKTFFDLLPEKALSKKPILPILNGGTTAHLLALEYALKPLFSVLGATEILNGVFIGDSQVKYSEAGVVFEDIEIENRLQSNVNELVQIINKLSIASLN
ncbi:NADPH-dependent FMN reductase [Bacillus marasmi]|uniref:NADPH-dependent FMN reductase n=1 Tax=Bacillus marasmi TaxID=1926279 RepID=UPI0011C89F3B|nr:NADPH-dependent FMN reductase [Bacillus marasmi]